MEKLIVGAIVVACLIYVVFRARRTFKSNGYGCGCGGGAEKKSCGCAGCNGCKDGEKGESSGCGRSE
ncbi:MAG: hypothetical protein IKK39_14455 [Thermoguttaceae bacterium]|nr:hypothetical protein [Thermoguttaceae bacterium]MBR4105246.1 hypothetical protein [Thermoguttaceae bacterium]